MELISWARGTPVPCCPHTTTYCTLTKLGMAICKLRWPNGSEEVPKQDSGGAD